MHHPHQDKLPAFPRTPHLPHLPNADATDVVAKPEEAAVIFGASLNVEEKIDGASVGVTIVDGHPVLRNRDHILNKGFMRKKDDTTAKRQFRPFWNWFYQHKKQIQTICDQGDYSIYGEWMYAAHGIHYTRLPDWFIAYDIYDWGHDQFLAPPKARRMLVEAGLSVPQLVSCGKFEGDYAALVAAANGRCEWADADREGVYIKVFNEQTITHRFKMVREGFVRGALFDQKELVKNEVRKGSMGVDA